MAEQEISNSQDFKDYLKCTWANKLTLAGYLSLLATFVLGYLCKETQLSYLGVITCGSLCSSVSLLQSTLFGLETLDTYQEARSYIRKFGKLKETFREIKERDYCTRAGLRLAAKEAGLELGLN